MADKTPAPAAPAKPKGVIDTISDTAHEALHHLRDAISEKLGITGDKGGGYRNPSTGRTPMQEADAQSSDGGSSDNGRTTGAIEAMNSGIKDAS